MSIQKTLYRSSLGLLTDLYQLTMAYGYWKAGMIDHEAVFHLVFRRAPFHGGYAICAGLGTAIEYIQELEFSDDDIAYLQTLQGSDGKPLFEQAFLDYLRTLRLQIDVDAIEEGTVIFPQEPLIRIKGPLLQCQLLETPLLAAINYQTLIATKAARICDAAQGDPVIEFGLRRAHGYDGGIMASRAAYIGGCQATSNTLAGKLYGIPVRGTHAHSWVMAFPTELESFQVYADVLPNNSVFLVDTYNTVEAVKQVVEIGKRLREQGHHLAGIRLDSGDLADLSIKARRLLDESGFKETVIIGSNDLDEHVISSLKAQGATIAVWGVGTRLVTAYDQPALDGVYKLSAVREPGQDWQYKLKLSEQIIKISTPGMSRARRFFVDGKAFADVIYDERLGLSDHFTMIDPHDLTKQFKMPKNAEGVELMSPIFRQGELVYTQPALAEVQQKTLKGLRQFPQGIKRLLNPHLYPVGLEKQLYDLKNQLIMKARGLSHG